MLQVEKPDKAGHDQFVKDLTDSIEALKEDRKKIQDKVDLAMNDPASKAKLTTLRSTFNELKNKKAMLINEKKHMREQLDQAKNQTDKLVKDKKDTRSQVRFATTQEIDAEVAKLKRAQETTTMTLNEEKKLIKEMDALLASKKFVDALKDKDVAMDSVKEQRKSIGDLIKAKDAEIDALAPEMDQVMEAIKTINETDNKKRDGLQDLFKQRDAIRKTVADKLKEKDTVRDEFRVKNNAWYDYQRAVKAQKKIQYEEERKQREQEKAEYQAKLDEEEAKKIPYEEEQALCDFLAEYLERTYLTGADKVEEKADAVTVVADDPFAGFQPVKKSDDDEYFGKGKQKKKRNRQKKQDSAGPFTLSVDMFEQFGLVQLDPPTAVDQVETSIKALREKKEWYKEQPRGSVPTAAEIRKANGKAAQKIRQQTDQADAPVKAKPAGSFSLSNDDFVPLGQGAAAAPANSSWGKST
jgi:uncharacterized coiled-coil DUF342 family protein